MKAFLANKQDVDSLRNARNQVHQPTARCNCSTCVAWRWSLTR